MGQLIGKLGGAIGPLTTTQPVMAGTNQPFDPASTLGSGGSAPTQTPDIKPIPFAQAASTGELVPGAGNAMSPGLTKAGKLVTLLTGGLKGALAGRAAQEQMIAQTGGRRAGGVGTGFEAAVQMPWQRAMQGQELQQAQAQTALTRAQAQMVPTPFGQMPAAFAKLMFPAIIRQQTQEDVTGKKIASTEDITNKKIASTEGIAARNVQSREQLGRYTAVPGVGLFDKTTKTVVPGTQAGVTITSEMAQSYGLPNEYVGKPMSIQQLAALENVQTARAPKVTQGESVQTDAQGNIVKIPTTHVTAPVLPNSVPMGATGGTPNRPRAAGTSTAKPVLDAQGNPLQSQAGAAKGAKWMSWDENGRTVAGPMSMAQQNGAQNPAEVPAQEVRDITNARNTVRLLTKNGDPKKPETQGVLQLIDSLDKDGKLGVLASRWNRFMTTGVGASPDDDPRIVTMLDKNMLGQTSAMLAHFGASGGRSPQMLQHFIDLANAGKMDGVTLRAGTKAIADYMTDKAMVPSQNVSGGKSGSQALKVTHVYNPSTGQLEAR